MNLLLRNALAFDRNIEAPDWNGKSYERVAYSDVSDTDYVDIYVPDSTEKMPLFILVHGGGFVANDSQSRQATLMYQYFRSVGYACASINYRLADEATYPAAVDDVKAAIRFLRANADKYGYDAEKFAIFGESAGGYLATMAAVSGEDEFTGVQYIGQTDDSVSAKVSALVDFYGVLDFDLYDDDFKDLQTPNWLLTLMGTNDNMNRESAITTRFIGQTIASLSAEERAAISPTRRVLNGTVDKNLKMYISHGSVDITVPKLQSKRLYEYGRGVLGDDNVVYKEMKNCKHADDRFYEPSNLINVKEFLDKVW
jgi:acetyl esterase/lipase